MAVTVPMPPVTLPVRLSIGNTIAEVGDVTMRTGEEALTALPRLLREIADEMDRKTTPTTPEV